MQCHDPPQPPLLWGGLAGLALMARAAPSPLGGYRAPLYRVGDPWNYPVLCVRLPLCSLPFVQLLCSEPPQSSVWWVMETPACIAMSQLEWEPPFPFWELHSPHPFPGVWVKCWCSPNLPQTFPSTVRLTQSSADLSSPGGITHGEFGEGHALLMACGSKIHIHR